MQSVFKRLRNLPGLRVKLNEEREMLIKIDASGFEGQNDVYWLNPDHIIGLIPHKDYVEISIIEWETNLKTKDTVMELLQKIETGKEGKITLSDF